MTRALLIINCSDKNRRFFALEEKAVWSLPGVEWKISYPTTIENFKAEIITARKESFLRVVVGGGDGSVSLAASILAGSATPLGIIPMGTVNALARSLSIPLSPVKALGLISPGQIRSIATGRVGEEFFLCFMSIGFDALAVHRVNEGVKKYLHRYAYIFSGIRALIERKKINPFRINREEFHHLMISNLKNYAGLEMFPGQAPDSGKMSASLLRANTVISNLGWFLKHPKSHAPDSRTLEAGKEWKLEYDEPLVLQLDGEPVPFKKISNQEKKIRIRVIEKDLKVILP